MKKIQKCFIGILTIIFLILLSINSFAVKGTFSVSKTSVSLTEGKSTTFNITTKNCGGKFSIISSDSSIVKVSTSSSWVEGTTTITLTAVKAGNAKVTVDATEVANSDPNDEGEVTGSKTISVTVKEKSSSNGGDSSSNETITKPTFTSKSQTVYATTNQVNVRSSYSTSSSILGSLQKGESVKRTGLATKSINGILWSKVSYNGKTGYISSSYLTTTKPSNKADNDKTDDNKNDEKKDESKVTSTKLKSLTVTPTGLSPAFSSSTTEYTMTVGSNINEIDVNAIAEDENATVKVAGNTNLKIGSNKITITVTSGKENKKYNINVTKEDKKQLQLSELLVEGLPLKPEFDSNIYEYKLTLDKSDISEINITATPSKKGAEVEIVGNTGLKEGENVVTILVKSENGEDVVTYQITVTLPKKQVVVEEHNNKDLYKYIGIGVSAFIILIIIIAIIKKCHNKDDDDMYYEMDNSNENDEDISEPFRKSGLTRGEEKSSTENMQNFNENMQTDTKLDRSKKIDEFYNVEDDVRPRRGGKHSK